MMADGDAIAWFGYVPYAIPLIGFALVWLVRLHRVRAELPPDRPTPRSS